MHFGCVFMGSATSVHFISHDGAGVWFYYMQLRKALARRPNNAPWDHVLLASHFPQMLTNQLQASFVYHHIYNRMTSFWLCLKLDKRN